MQSVINPIVTACSALLGFVSYLSHPSHAYISICTFLVGAIFSVIFESFQKEDDRFIVFVVMHLCIFAAKHAFIFWYEDKFSKEQKALPPSSRMVNSWISPVHLGLFRSDHLFHKLKHFMVSGFLNTLLFTLMLQMHVRSQYSLIKVAVQLFFGTGSMDLLVDIFKHSLSAFKTIPENSNPKYKQMVKENRSQALYKIGFIFLFLVQTCQFGSPQCGHVLAIQNVYIAVLLVSNFIALVCLNSFRPNSKRFKGMLMTICLLVALSVPFRPPVNPRIGSCIVEKNNEPLRDTPVVLAETLKTPVDIPVSVPNESLKTPVDIPASVPNESLKTPVDIPVSVPNESLKTYPVIDPETIVTVQNNKNETVQLLEKCTHSTPGYTHCSYRKIPASVPLIEDPPAPLVNESNTSVSNNAEAWHVKLSSPTNLKSKRPSFSVSNKTKLPDSPVPVSNKTKLPDPPVPVSNTTKLPDPPVPLVTESSTTVSNEEKLPILDPVLKIVDNQFVLQEEKQPIPEPSIPLSVNHSSVVNNTHSDVYSLFSLSFSLFSMGWKASLFFFKFFWGTVYQFCSVIPLPVVYVLTALITLITAILACMLQCRKTFKRKKRESVSISSRNATPIPVGKNKPSSITTIEMLQEMPKDSLDNPSRTDSFHGKGKPLSPRFLVAPKKPTTLDERRDLLAGPLERKKSIITESLDSPRPVSTALESSSSKPSFCPTHSLKAMNREQTAAKIQKEKFPLTLLADILAVVIEIDESMIVTQSQLEHHVIEKLNKKKEEAALVKPNEVPKLKSNDKKRKARDSITSPSDSGTDRRQSKRKKSH